MVHVFRARMVLDLMCIQAVEDSVIRVIYTRQFVSEWEGELRHTSITVQRNL